MKPLKIYFKIIKIGNGKLLKNKDEVNNFIVDFIKRNPSEPVENIRKQAINELSNTSAGKQITEMNNIFFISNVTDIEIAITFLPEEKSLQEQFYTQWRYVQRSSPYRLVQFLDEQRVVVYSERTGVLHTVKLSKEITIVADQD